MLVWAVKFRLGATYSFYVDNAVACTCWEYGPWVWAVDNAIWSWRWRRVGGLTWREGLGGRAPHRATTVSVSLLHSILSRRSFETPTRPSPRAASLCLWEFWLVSWPPSCNSGSPGESLRPESAGPSCRWRGRDRSFSETIATLSARSFWEPFFRRSTVIEIEKWFEHRLGSSSSRSFGRFRGGFGFRFSLQRTQPTREEKSVRDDRRLSPRGKPISLSVQKNL